MSTFEHRSVALLGEALETLEAGFASLPAIEDVVDEQAVREVLLETARRMQDNYPYHHPYYLGQMLKPPHPLARLAYALSMWVNPNNHALDGGRASSRMEKAAVAEIAGMFGWETHLGHLCGGGTIANFEALWVGRALRPRSTIVASEQAHYTHSRLSAVLHVPFEAVPVDARGRMDPGALQRTLAKGGVGTVVATLGTTAAGTVDPLPEIVHLAREHGARVHVDAAYGGYYRLAGNLSAEVAASFASIGQADSVVVDPHKHGLQPYGCGCVLFKDPSVGRFYRHDSPYTYFTSGELHLGEISLECSRAGASAVALWATLQLLPLCREGAFARGLEQCRVAALELHGWLQAAPGLSPLLEPELDIVVWAVEAATASESSALAEKIFEAAARADLHLALASFPKGMCAAAAPVREWDTPTLRCLRACVMKPEHEHWMPRLLGRLERARGSVLGGAGA